MARLVFGFEPIRFEPRTRVFLPLRFKVLTLRTLTPQMASTASWISGFDALGWTLNV